MSKTMVAMSGGVDSSVVAAILKEQKENKVNLGKKAYEEEMEELYYEHMGFPGGYEEE